MAFAAPGISATADAITATDERPSMSLRMAVPPRGKYTAPVRSNRHTTREFGMGARPSVAARSVRASLALLLLDERLRLGAARWDLPRHLRHEQHGLDRPSTRSLVSVRRGEFGFWRPQGA